MVARAGLLLLHETARPVITFPAASNAVAMNALVLTAGMENVEGVTVTLAIGTKDTVTVVLVVFPSTMAVMVVVPAATAVSMP